MTNSTKDSARYIENILRQHELDITVVRFPEFTRTAKEAADAIGCEIGQIAKTLIFKETITHRPVVIIASGKNRINEKKIEEYIGQPIEKSDADYVRTHTGFAIGGIPPIGYTLDSNPLIDEDLMAYNEIWAAAGTPHAVFKITPQSLLTLTQGHIISIT